MRIETIEAIVTALIARATAESERHDVHSNEWAECYGRMSAAREILALAREADRTDK